MTGSKTIKAVMAAMAKAQADMAMPKKDGKNPHFKSKYATLSSVLECINKPCMDAGLVITQNVEYDHNQTQHGTNVTTEVTGMGDILITNVHHVESGEWIASTCRLLLEKKTPQGIGSAITYMRRYALMSMFLLNAEDDDGEGAEHRGRTNSSPNSKSPTAPTKPAPATSTSLDSVIKQFNKAKDRPALDKLISEFAGFLQTCDAYGKKKATEAIQERREILTQQAIAKLQEPHEGAN